MKHPAQRIAALLTLFCALAPAVHAQVVGTVANLSGVLSVRSAEGATRLLAVDSPIRQGDTLTTESRAYAQLRFSDGAEIVLQPESMLVVTRYDYDAAQPQRDRVELGLAQGGLRSSVGLVARRSPDATVFRTPKGTLQGAASMIVSVQP